MRVHTQFVSEARKPRRLGATLALAAGIAVLLLGIESSASPSAVVSRLLGSQLTQIRGQAQSVTKGAAIWQQRCAQCHGRESEFAKAELRLVDGVLVVHASGTPVSEYMQSGHGRIRPDEVPAVIDSLIEALRASPSSS